MATAAEGGEGPESPSAKSPHQRRHRRRISEGQQHQRVTMDDINRVAALLPLDPTTGRTRVHLARDLTTDLFLHYQYVRVYSETVERNPFRVRRVRKCGKAYQESVISRLTFQKYVAGLCCVIVRGTYDVKVRLLFDCYARAVEGHITWTEVSALLRGHTSLLAEQDTSHELQLQFEAKSAIASEHVRGLLYPGQPYEPAIPREAYMELMMAYEGRLRVQVDIRALVRDVRRFEMADTMALSSF